MKQSGDDGIQLFPRRVGEDLAAERTARNLDLSEIAERTRVPLRHLAAIESGDYAALPAPTYSTGFVRTYARELGLDAAALATRFRGEVGMAERPTQTVSSFEPADPARVPTRLLAWIALAAAILLALSYGVWRSGILTGDTAEDRQRLAAGTSGEQLPFDQPAARGPAAAPRQAAVPAGPITLTATEPVWIKVYERGGATLFMGELKAGAPYTVPANATDPLLITGRPQSLKVSVGSRLVPPLGDGSRTVSDVSLKADALLGRAASGAPRVPATPVRANP